MTFSRKVLDYRVEPFSLRLFAAVLEHGTITSAAHAMSLSLTAASTRLKQLEHTVGVQLLVRSKSGALPTDAGRAHARHAGRVLLELDALHTEMADFGRGLRGTVRLLCNTATMTGTLPPVLGRFLVQHPDLDIDLWERVSQSCLAAPRSGGASKLWKLYRSRTLGPTGSFYCARLNGPLDRSAPRHWWIFSPRQPRGPAATYSNREEL